MTGSYHGVAGGVAGGVAAGVAGGVAGGVLPSCNILQHIVLCWATSVKSVRISDGGLFAPPTASLASLYNFSFF